MNCSARSIWCRRVEHFRVRDDPKELGETEDWNAPRLGALCERIEGVAGDAVSRSSSERCAATRTLVSTAINRGRP